MFSQQPENHLKNFSGWYAIVKPRFYFISNLIGNMPVCAHPQAGFNNLLSIKQLFRAICLCYENGQAIHTN
jgi:hypothetical protein